MKSDLSVSAFPQILLCCYFCALSQIKSLTTLDSIFSVSFYATRASHNLLQTHANTHLISVSFYFTDWKARTTGVLHNPGCNECSFSHLWEYKSSQPHLRKYAHEKLLCSFTCAMQCLNLSYDRNKIADRQRNKNSTVCLFCIVFSFLCCDGKHGQLLGFSFMCNSNSCTDHQNKRQKLEQPLRNQMIASVRRSVFYPTQIALNTWNHIIEIMRV